MINSLLSDGPVFPGSVLLWNRCWCYVAAAVLSCYRRHGVSPLCPRSLSASSWLAGTSCELPVGGLCAPCPPELCSGCPAGAFITEVINYVVRLRSTALRLGLSSLCLYCSRFLASLCFGSAWLLSPFLAYSIQLFVSFSGGFYSL